MIDFDYFNGFFYNNPKAKKNWGNYNNKSNPGEGLPCYIIERLHINNYNLKYE